MSTALLCFQYYDPLIGFYPIEKGEKIYVEAKAKDKAEAEAEEEENLYSSFEYGNGSIVE